MFRFIFLRVILLFFLTLVFFSLHFICVFAGSLDDVLRNPSVVLSRKQRCKMALDTARALQYMHTRTPAIIHRDIKSANVLVSFSLSLCLLAHTCAHIYSCIHFHLQFHASVAVNEE